MKIQPIENHSSHYCTTLQEVKEALKDIQEVYVQVTNTEVWLRVSKQEIHDLIRCKHEIDVDRYEDRQEAYVTAMPY